ncbi:hypothetical protein [Vibrio hepatarius]|uniref:hypothetical protein n=1 Tax=Vibrio hepatarius TaxID=171383 RepID=UPI001C0A5B60|nr:hypothetical protein [Vibrio hepatarius]MBU2895878.1 hypothetical protein [Vibrio hepatarius]
MIFRSTSVPNIGANHDSSSQGADGNGPRLTRATSLLDERQMQRIIENNLMAKQQTPDSFSLGPTPLPSDNESHDADSETDSDKETGRGKAQTKKKVEKAYSGKFSPERKAKIHLGLMVPGGILALALVPFCPVAGVAIAAYMNTILCGIHGGKVFNLGDQPENKSKDEKPNEDKPEENASESPKPKDPTKAEPEPRPNIDPDKKDDEPEADKVKRERENDSQGSVIINNTYNIAGDTYNIRDIYHGDIYVHERDGSPLGDTNTDGADKPNLRLVSVSTVTDKDLSDKVKKEFGTQSDSTHPETMFKATVTDGSNQADVYVRTDQNLCNLITRAVQTDDNTSANTAIGPDEYLSIDSAIDEYDLIGPLPMTTKDIRNADRKLQPQFSTVIDGYRKGEDGKWEPISPASDFIGGPDSAQRISTQPKTHKDSKGVTANPTIGKEQSTQGEETSTVGADMPTAATTGGQPSTNTPADTVIDGYRKGEDGKWKPISPASDFIGGPDSAQRISNQPKAPKDSTGVTANSTIGKEQNTQSDDTSTVGADTSSTAKTDGPPSTNTATGTVVDGYRKGQDGKWTPINPTSDFIGGPDSAQRISNQPKTPKDSTGVTANPSISDEAQTAKVVTPQTPVQSTAESHSITPEQAETDGPSTPTTGTTYKDRASPTPEGESTTPSLANTQPSEVARNTYVNEVKLQVGAYDTNRSADAVATEQVDETLESHTSSTHISFIKKDINVSHELQTEIQLASTSENNENAVQDMNDSDKSDKARTFINEAYIDFKMPIAISKPARAVSNTFNGRLERQEIDGKVKWVLTNPEGEKSPRGNKTVILSHGSSVSAMARNYTKVTKNGEPLFYNVVDIDTSKRHHVKQINGWLTNTNEPYKSFFGRHFASPRQDKNLKLVS